MKYLDWRVFVFLCIVLGVTFVFGGFVFWFYSETPHSDYGIWSRTYPYRSIAIIPFALGIFFLLVGALTLVRGEEEEELEIEESKIL
jgi:uncharacterized membrane protein HdeD (DUF308 family)